MGDISGSLFTDLELADLQISTLEPTDTPLKATIANVRLGYSLIDLLQGIDTFIGGLTIELDRPTVHIDLSRPPSEALPDDAQDAFDGLPAILPHVSINDGRLELEGDGYGSRFDGIMLSSLTGSGKAANALKSRYRTGAGICRRCVTGRSKPVPGLTWNRPGGWLCINSR